jgi:alpha-L-arabinofuranosidase
MSKLLFAGAASCLFMSGCGQKDAIPTAKEEPSPQSEQGFSVQYTVDTAPSGPGTDAQISQNLYGIFLEDINFALDGGMYAELVKNRSFEYGSLASGGNLHGWVNGDPQGGLSVQVVDGSTNGTALNGANPHYAVIENQSPEYLGIFNKGFEEGLSVQEGETYICNLFLRASAGYGSEVHVSVKDADSKVLGEAVIPSITGSWAKYSVSLPITQEVTPGEELRFYLEIGEGCVWADMVSLMPEDTYKGLPIRKDIGLYLEALTPSFLRFPGGCVIEGKDLESMYSWKDSIGSGAQFMVNGQMTVGDPAVRPMGRSIWTGNANYPYYTTYGIGFYEFFCLCEALDCMPVPVLNAGMTCQVQSPEYIVFEPDSPEFAQCVQDALDLVEFCKGDASTKWGQVRTAMGHPEPFDLTYIGIGNEQWQTEYFEHYSLFVQAFEDAAAQNPSLYEGIQLIVANSTSSGDRVGWNYLENHPDDLTGLVDEHYYESPDWFLTHTKRYDGYDRDTQAKVFLGEYAAKSNTLEAALAEAAYMTGLERNSDIVEMACYAPLFANQVSNQWTPDMIWLSQSSLFGSVNYYVQKMFSNHLGKILLPSHLQVSLTESESSLTGKIGLGTWQTNAAFDNLKVVSNEDGSVLYSCDFSDPEDLRSKDWDIHEGDWSIQDGRLIQENTKDPADTNTGDVLYLGDPSWSNYTVTVDVEKLQGKEGFLLPIAVTNSANNIFWNIGGWGNTVSCLQSVTSHVKSGQLSGTVKNLTLQEGQVYHLKVQVEGRQIKCYLNDTLYVDYTLETPDPIYETASLDEQGNVILKLVNVTSSLAQIQITLNDLDISQYQPQGTVTVLVGTDLQEANSYEEPEKLVPQETTLDVAQTMTYQLPPYSVNIIQIPKKD